MLWKGLNLDYRALEEVHFSVPPATLTTICHSFTLVGSLRNPLFLVPLPGNVHIFGFTSDLKRRDGDLPVGCALLSCTLSPTPARCERHHTPPPSRHPRNPILLPNKSDAIDKQICFAWTRENIRKITTHPTLPSNL